MDDPAPLIVTKILRPRLRDDLLHRRRLVDFIHARTDRKLILISAPAGYGKTSVLIDYAHDSDLPVCWYTLDERDSDPYVFLEYLIASIRRRFSDFGKQIRAVLNSAESRLPDWDTIAAALVNDMVDAIGEYFIIVLDDYHHIEDDSGVHPLLDTLLRYLPEHCHIILASRTLPPLTLTRMAAQQEVDGLSVNELRFTTGEIQELMEQNCDLELPDEQAQELAEELGGWIAGLLLTRHTLWKGLFAGMIRAQGETQVFEYLATEVFEQQTEDIQKYLLDSAILDEMSPDLCNQLLETNSAGETLRYLEAQNLFISRLEGPGEWYRYHQLFREFLRSYLQSADPERYRELHLQAAQLFTHQSEPTSAIQHYLEAEAFDEAAEVIEPVAEETFNTGRWATLARWIDALPPAFLQQRPRLMIHRAKVYIQTGQLPDAVRQLDLACETAHAHGNAENQATALVFKSIALRMQGAYEGSIEQCEQALGVLGDSESAVAAQAYRNIGIAYGVLGKLSDSIEQLNHALRLYEERGKAYHIASVHHDLATTYLRAGDLAHASTHYRPALRHWRETENPARISETLNAMGCALYYQGAYEPARELLEEALVEARTAQYTRVEAAVLASLGDIARVADAHEKALDLYQQALDVAETISEESIVAYVLNAIGLTHCILGEYSQAQTRIAEALSLGKRVGSIYDIGLSEDALGVLFRARSNHDMAVHHFTEARNHFEKCSAKRSLAIANLHLAQVLFDQDAASSDVLGYLEEALGLADELGYDHFLVTEGRQSADLYKHAAAHQIGDGRLTHILEHLGEEAPAPSEVVEPEPASTPESEIVLRAQAFGQAQAWLNREPISKRQWDSVTTKELFFYLISHPEGVRKEKILEDFWPEATPAKGSSAFHSTNYRLRRALQDQDCILYKDGVYVINPEIRYWYDVEIFGDLIEQAESAESDAERASLYHQAIELYKGDYLEEFYSDWQYFPREKLQRQYFDALEHLAEYHRENEQAEEALILFERIVAEDPYKEEIHREIMRLYAGLSQRAAAAKHYQELKELLWEDLEIDPMPETAELYEAIVGSVESDEEEPA
ncbi:MAG: HTH-type transcriptional regulator MalT [Anaerolineales bacterium]|nr:HTH-type transcriptional regulator MalT [Anaerolineales bacterium]